MASVSQACCRPRTFTSTLQPMVWSGNDVTLAPDVSIATTLDLPTPESPTTRILTLGMFRESVVLCTTTHQRHHTRRRRSHDHFNMRWHNRQQHWTVVNDGAWEDGCSRNRRVTYIEIAAA